MADTTTTSISSSSGAYPFTIGLRDLIGKHEGGTIAIVGTGLSLETVDFSAIREDENGKVWTIGMNEAARLFVPDYLTVCDPSAFQKMWSAIDLKTHVVLGARCHRLASEQPPVEPSGRSAQDSLRESGGVTVVKYTVTPEVDPMNSLFWDRGIITGALSLAVVLGAEHVKLYGCDFYREKDRCYAWDVGQAKSENLETIGDGQFRRFLTPAFRAMRSAVGQHLSAWQSLKVVNMSRHSQLGCFPISTEAK